MSQKQTKFYTCKEDLTFKYVMLDDKSKDILSTILELVLKKKINKIILLPTEELEDNIKIKNKRVDAYIETNEGNINIEVNSNYKKYVHIRNMAYICNFYERNFLSGEAYNEKIDFIQINLTYGLPKSDNKIIRKYGVIDEEGKPFVKNFIIYEINMDKVMKFWYDKDKEKIEEFKHLIMLDLNEEELSILSKEDKVVRKYMDKLVKVNSDPKFQKYMSAEEDARKIRNSELEEAKEEGISQGIEQGIEQGILITAKNMLENKVKIEEISKYTGLSVEKIELLK